MPDPEETVKTYKALAAATFVVLYPDGRQYTRAGGRVWLFGVLEALCIAAEIDGTTIQHRR